jgi:hypothetical protein
MVSLASSVPTPRSTALLLAHYIVPGLLTALTSLLTNLATATCGEVRTKVTRGVYLFEISVSRINFHVSWN